MLIWVIGCLAIIVYSIVNLQSFKVRKPSPMSLEFIEMEKGDMEAPPAGGAVLGIPLFVIAPVSVLRAEFSGSDKLVWILVIIFLLVLGPILYFIIGRKQRFDKKTV